MDRQGTETRMTIDTLGYVKRLESAGIDRRHAEAHAEAMRDQVAPQLATDAALKALGTDLDSRIKAVADRLDNRITTEVTRLEQKIETLMWKHSLGVLLGVLTHRRPPVAPPAIGQGL
jgi:hypothetical protein